MRDLHAKYKRVKARKKKKEKKKRKKRVKCKVIEKWDRNNSVARIQFMLMQYLHANVLVYFLSVCVCVCTRAICWWVFVFALSPCGVFLFAIFSQHFILLFFFAIIFIHSHCTAKKMQSNDRVFGPIFCILCALLQEHIIMFCNKFNQTKWFSSYHTSNFHWIKSRFSL